MGKGSKELGENKGNWDNTELLKALNENINSSKSEIQPELKTQNYALQNEEIIEEDDS